MDNREILQSQSGQSVQSSNGYQSGSGGPMPMVQQVKVPTQSGKDIAGLIKTIVIIVVSLIAITFIGLFIWMLTQYNEASADVEGQINVAVAAAKDEQAQKYEAEFLEREKYPYKTFSGPADYGQLTFEYPKIWSVYVAADASAGGDFSAYFNPNQVEAINSGAVNALRVAILNKSFDNVIADYQKEMNKKDSDLIMETVTINDTVANRYVGTIPGTNFSGIIVVFKIRDKTAILRTESLLFQKDFDELVGTIEFNS